MGYRAIQGFGCVKNHNAAQHGGTIMEKVGRPTKRGPLTEEQVRAIRNDYRPIKVVAEAHGVSRWTVIGIRSGTVYAWVI